MRHIFLRGEYCSKECFEGYKRDEAHRLRWEEQHGEFQDTEISLQPSQDDAHAAIWAGILGAAKQLGNRELPPTKRRPLVTSLQEGKSNTPLYFINAGLSEFRLAQLMPGNPIFGIDIPWPLAWRRAATTNDVSALPTMEQLVAPYVAALSAHTHASTCVLAGYSFGGMMAFEAAHQLQELGRTVEMVILIDSPAQYPNEPAPHQIAWQKLQQDWQRSLPDRTTHSIASRLRSSSFIVCWMLAKEIRRLGLRSIETMLQDPGRLTSRVDEVGMPLHWRLIERLYAKAVESYRLRCVNSRGVLFLADSKDERPFRDLGRSLGWDNLFSGGLDVIQATGDHVTMMQPGPDIRVLAQKITQLLNRSWISV
jgi:thioesterase domain-containing protein